MSNTSQAFRSTARKRSRALPGEVAEPINSKGVCSHHMIFESLSAADTARIAADFGRSAEPGDVFCLSGPLGAGKTAFAQGFAQGLGYSGRVSSPTFTIMHVHEGGRLPLYHFDLYRLTGGVTELEGIGYEDYFYADGVCLVEWPEQAVGAIPKTARNVEIRMDTARGLDYREIQILL